MTVSPPSDFLALNLQFASIAAHGLHPRLCRHALPHVLAACVHPRPASTSAGLLLVRPMLIFSSVLLLQELTRNVGPVTCNAVDDTKLKILTSK